METKIEMGKLEDKNKKKIVKKSVDIESEFIGVPVARKGKKEKKTDLTDEIKEFFKGPIDLESIKKMLLRLHGPISEYDIKTSLMKIYGIPGKRLMDYFIVINNKKRGYRYYLGGFMFVSLDFFHKQALDDSYLRQALANKLKNWLYNNPEQITVLKVD